jgi:fluoride exporter
VFIRIGISELSEYTAIPLFPTLFSLIVGCMLMGITLEHKQKLSLYPSLYTGISTGLCGSVTTFSAWMLEATDVMTQWSSFTRPSSIYDMNLGTGAFSRFAHWITIILLGFGMSATSLTFGKYAGTLSRFHNEAVSSNKPQCTSQTGNRTTSSFIVLSVCLIVVLATVISICIAAERYDYMFDALLAPIGAILRFRLSTWNSHTFKTKHGIYVGTFAANIIGTCVLGIVAVLFEELDLSSKVINGLISGIMAGLCGCLTTVSTFIVEISTLGSKQAYRYGAVSVLVAQAVLVLTTVIYNAST